MNDELLYVPTKKYVYFDDFGELVAVSNNNKEVGNYIEVEQADVIDIITGNEQPSHFCISFDGIEKKYVLKSKTKEIENKFSIKNNISKIESNVTNADIVIKQDVKNKCWIINLDNKIKKTIKLKEHSYKSLLHFAVTEKNDPHVLYHYFVIYLEDLINKSTVKIPFNSQKEQDKENISVYTNKKFQNYSRKFVNG